MNLREKILRGVQDLPTLPTVYSALSDAMANPGSTAEGISQIIASDQASAFRVLRVVNSAFYGIPGRVDTVSRAVVILGFDEVRNLVLATSVMNLFSKKDTSLDFRPSDFWGHSIAVGLLARLIGHAAGVPSQENLFVAGILHDIGKLILFEVAEEEFVRALTVAAESKRSLREAEREILGMDHTKAGDLLSDRWKLPTLIRNTIRNHHSGTVAGKVDPLVASVHVADFVARALVMGFSGDDMVQQPNEEVWETIKMRPGMLEERIPEVLGQFEDAVSVLLQN